MKKVKGHIDWLVLIPVVGLMLFSVAFVYSASASIAELRYGSADSLFLKHLFRVIIGIVVIIIFAKIDYHFWMKLSKSAMVVALTLLVIVLFSGKVNEVNRWINLGPLSFQPSEFAKFALVLHFAVLLSIKQSVMKDFNLGFIPFMLWTIVTCVLIALQPNFSTASVIFLISMSMLFIGNANLLHLITVCLGAAAAAISYLWLTAGYRLSRIASYIGEHGNNSDNYQLDQALIALGNGGFIGVGAGQSRQSHLFLPESYGDFIFSIIGEEYGFVGIILILLAFAVIFWRGWIIARKAPDNFGYFLAAGITITFAYYVFVNAGVNSGLLPTTGLPMPFISYGGTAVVIYGAAIGILLNISSQAGIFPQKSPNVN